MTTRLLMPVLSGAMLLPVLAHAHPGNHGGMTGSETVSHFSGSLFHMAGFAAVTIAAFAVLAYRRERRLAAIRKAGSRR